MVSIFKYSLQSALLFFLIAFNGPGSKTYQWTRFRGTDGSGIDNIASSRITWDSTDYKWNIQLPGTGNASPVVWGNKIFITSSEEEKNLGYLFAIDEDSGGILWQKEFPVSDLKMHIDNDLAMPTPVVDEAQVYVIWYSIEMTTLIALSHEGAIHWQAEYGGIEARHGGGSSLMLTDNYVVFTREQEEGSSQKSSWVAVNKKTGETAWELNRESVKSNSFSTPVLEVIENRNTQLIFASMAHGITSVEPETGEVLWERKNLLPDRVVSSPLYSEGFIVACRRGGGMVIKMDENTNEAADTALYSLPRQISPYVPTPIIVGELLFLYTDNGTVACVRLATGEVLWKERPAGAIYGSPIFVNGILYCITKEGEVLVIHPDENYQLLGIQALGEGSFSTPAMCGSGMLFRTFSQLILVGNE